MAEELTRPALGMDSVGFSSEHVATWLISEVWRWIFVDLGLFECNLLWDLGTMARRPRHHGGRHFREWLPGFL